MLMIIRIIFIRTNIEEGTQDLMFHLSFNSHKQHKMIKQQRLMSTQT
jgi:hypothetical protein